MPLLNGHVVMTSRVMNDIRLLCTCEWREVRKTPKGAQSAIDRHLDQVRTDEQVAEALRDCGVVREGERA